MSKTAIMTDSNSGITQAEAKELGIEVIPMPFTINEKTYYEDISLTQEQFYKFLSEDADISTSQPTPADVIATWNRLLKDYDEIVHIPMSSGLSGSYQTASLLAQDFDGRVQVVNNQRISVTQRQSVLDAMEMADNGISAKRIKKYLEKTKFDSSIYITVETLKYLKKGGRVTATGAALASLFKIKPILQIQGEKLDAYSKARTKKTAKKIMLNAIENDIAKRYNASDDNSKVHIHLAFSGTDTTDIFEFRDEVKEIYPNHSLFVAPLSLSISCHIGSGSIAITATKKLDLNEVE
ncbi:MAG: DegV family protein [Clostridia bacterium]|jgi:DegV family protein with EDD domain|nr:DegV family protein [Clostridia bacterium]MCI1999280.1 DegV family protein [Clostridia bacterium]MCI2014767.1 DegV family protein [Clostridia bacterium]